MSTAHVQTAAEIFEALAAPFDDSELRTRDLKKDNRVIRTLTYITARTARRRLNEVVGVDGWENKIQVTPDGVLCALTIHLPDGRSLTRSALGGYRNTAEAQDRSKSADSDAFKRACVLFRIGEYLYGEEGDEHPSPGPARVGDRRPEQRRPDVRQQNGQARNGDSRRGTSTWANAYREREPAGDNGPRDGSQPRDGKALYAWVRDREERHPDGAGLLAHVQEWGIQHGFPDKFFRYSFDQVKAAYAEGQRYLASDAGDAPVRR